MKNSTKIETLHDKMCSKGNSRLWKKISIFFQNLEQPMSCISTSKFNRLSSLGFIDA